MDAEQIARVQQLAPRLLPPLLSSRTNVSVSPSISLTKLRKARGSYIDHGDGDTVLVLYDETVLGSAKVGFAITDKALVYNLPPTSADPTRLKATFQLRDINTIEFRKNDLTCDVVINGVQTCNATSLNTKDALALQTLFDRVMTGGEPPAGEL